MDNRIDPLSVAPLLERQTPRDDFGAALARGVAQVPGALLGAALPLVPAGAVLSAASSLPQRFAEGASTTAAGTGSAQPEAGAGSGSTEGLATMLTRNQRWSEEYLAIQNAMQRESREYTALSNILKVRHESAKTAINNVR